MFFAVMKIASVEVRRKEQHGGKLLPYRLKDQERIVWVPSQNSNGLDLPIMRGVSCPLL
jgi:hypothetical protein